MFRINIVRITGILFAFTLSSTLATAGEIKSFSRTPTAEEIARALRSPQRGISLGEDAPAGTCDSYRQSERPKLRGVKQGNPVQEEEGPDIVALRIHFAYDSATISPKAVPTLQVMADAFNGKDLKGNCIQIEGHTDSKGSDEYNLKLSQQRAESIVAYLSEKLKVDRKYLIPVGKGEKDPLASNDTNQGRAQNRRVQLVNRGLPQAAGTGSTDDDGWKDNH